MLFSWVIYFLFVTWHLRKGAFVGISDGDLDYWDMHFLMSSLYEYMVSTYQK